jgi:chromosome segregation ATPase
MSSRRLVQRSNEPASVSSRQTRAMPPYQRPSHAMSAARQRQLMELFTCHDHDKLRKHIKEAIKNVSDCAADGNERLTTVRAEHARLVQRRKDKADEGAEPAAPDEIEKKVEQRLCTLEKEIHALTGTAEETLRALIDHGDEVRQQQSLLSGVLGDISANVRTARPSRSQRAASDEAEEAMDISAIEPAEAAPSVVELLRGAREEYTKQYQSHSLRKR